MRTGPKRRGRGLAVRMGGLVAATIAGIMLFWPGTEPGPGRGPEEEAGAGTGATAVAASFGARETSEAMSPWEPRATREVVLRVETRPTGAPRRSYVVRRGAGAEGGGGAGAVRARASSHSSRRDGSRAAFGLAIEGAGDALVFVYEPYPLEVTAESAWLVRWPRELDASPERGLEFALREVLSSDEPSSAAGFARLAPETPAGEIVIASTGDRVARVVMEGRWRTRGREGDEPTWVGPLEIVRGPVADDGEASRDGEG